jgi:hypothetical protein
MRAIQLTLLVGSVLLTQNCSPEQPQTTLRDLQGSYGAQGCSEFSISGSRIIASDVSTSFVIERIKGQDYVMPDRGIAVDDAACRLVPYHIPELIVIGATSGDLTLDVLGTSQRTDVRFSRATRK